MTGVFCLFLISVFYDITQLSSHLHCCWWKSCHILSSFHLYVMCRFSLFAFKISLYHRFWALWLLYGLVPSSSWFLCLDFMEPPVFVGVYFPTNSETFPSLLLQMHFLYTSPLLLCTQITRILCCSDHLSYYFTWDSFHCYVFIQLNFCLTFYHWVTFNWFFSPLYGLYFPAYVYVRSFFIWCQKYFEL